MKKLPLIAIVGVFLMTDAMGRGGGFSAPSRSSFSAPRSSPSRSSFSAPSRPSAPASTPKYTAPAKPAPSAPKYTAPSSGTTSKPSTSISYAPTVVVQQQSTPWFHYFMFYQMMHGNRNSTVYLDNYGHPVPIGANGDPVGYRCHGGGCSRRVCEKY